MSFHERMPASCLPTYHEGFIIFISQRSWSTVHAETDCVSLTADIAIAAVMSCVRHNGAVCVIKVTCSSSRNRDLHHKSLSVITGLWDSAWALDIIIEPWTLSNKPWASSSVITGHWTSSRPLDIITGRGHHHGPRGLLMPSRGLWRHRWAVALIMDHGVITGRGRHHVTALISTR